MGGECIGFKFFSFVFLKGGGGNGHRDPRISSKCSYKASPCFYRDSYPR